MMSYRTTAALAMLLYIVTACGQVESATPAPMTETATRAAPTLTAAPATPTPAPPTTQPTTLPPAPTVEPNPEATGTVVAAPASDMVALSPQTAPPTPDAALAAPVNAAHPARLIIPAINLDTPTISVGLDADRVPIVPKHDVGWFTYSAVPGQGTNIVLWGHVLRWLDSPEIAAPFERMEELTLGAEIVVVTADEQQHRYRITEQIRVLPTETQLLFATPTERLTLVSCIGDKVIEQGTLTKEFRLVTIAEPVS